MNQIKIGNKIIGTGKPVFYIAEAGVNHNGSLKIAKKLVDIAVDCGADAVKFQSFLADEIIIPKGQKANYHIETTGSDKTQSWYELLKSQEMSKRMHLNLINYCKKKKIIFLSTPYDTKSADLLDTLRVKAYKVASTDNDNYPFIEYLVKKKKPLIISTAMASLKDVEYVYALLKKKKFHNFAFLQCTGNYPSKLEDSNLSVISLYKEKFNCPIGFSDHTQDDISIITAVGLGAKIIEKHFTLNKKLYGPDHRMSLSPLELKESIAKVRLAEKSLGKKNKFVLKSEKINKLRLKKSLVAAEDIKKGTRIAKKLIKIKRPGNGIRPINLLKIIGLHSIKNINKDELFHLNMFKKK